MFWFGVELRCLGCECRLLEKIENVELYEMVAWSRSVALCLVWYACLENVGHPQLRQWRAPRATPLDVTTSQVSVVRFLAQQGGSCSASLSPQVVSTCMIHLTLHVNTWNLTFLTTSVTPAGSWWLKRSGFERKDLEQRLENAELSFFEGHPER